MIKLGGFLCWRKRLVEKPNESNMFIVVICGIYWCSKFLSWVFYLYFENQRASWGRWWTPDRWETGVVENLSETYVIVIVAGWSISLMPHSNRIQIAFGLGSNAVWMQLNVANMLFYGLWSLICERNGQIWPYKSAPNGVNEAVMYWKSFGKER